CVNIWQYCVHMLFCSAYGDSGLGGMSSCLGSVGALPYSDDDPAKTRRLTPASRAATSTLSVASMLARFEVMGSETDRGTDRIAAWCSTYSMPATARAAKAKSARSPSTSSMPEM